MVVKTIFLVSRGHFWRINFLFHKIFKFFSCFQTLRKTFCIFGENNLVGLSELFSTVQGKFSEEFVFENKFVEMFLYIWSSVTSFWTFGEKFAIGSSKLHSMCPVEIFDWTVFSTKFYEFFHRLRTVRKKFWPFGAKASKRLSKLQFMCTKVFCWKFDSWKNVHNFFEYWSKILRTLSTNVE